jgi:hypothetical protein
MLHMKLPTQLSQLNFKCHKKICGGGKSVGNTGVDTILTNHQ